MKLHQALIGVGIVVMTAAPVHGQQKNLEDQLYSTPNQATLDKNFGLPTFGMPGAELPRQRTQAPDPEPRADPELLTGALRTEPRADPDQLAGTLPIARPKARKLVNPTETPLFTTTQGATNTDATTTGDVVTTGDLMTTSVTTTRMTTDETDALMTTK